MTQRSSPDLENQYPQVSESGAPRDDRRRPILARRTDETGVTANRKTRRCVNRSAV
jgi:hypothetical protein